MALFMDRHEMSGALESVSPEDVASLHVTDLDVEARYGVRCLTYWFQMGSPTAFCLFEAPSAEAAVAVHREAHGNLPAEIIEVDWRSVDSFLGRIREPQRGEAWEDVARRYLLCTEIDNAEGLTHDFGAAAFGRFEQHDRLVLENLQQRGASNVTGGRRGVVGCFVSLEGALECALAIQQSFGPVSLFYQHAPLRVRIGVTTGDPVFARPGLFEAAMDEAAAICADAEGGQVLVAEAVADRGAAKGFSFVETDKTFLDATGAAQRLFVLASRADTRSEAGRAATDGMHSPFPDGLSRREVEVLQLIAAGRTNQEIAERLFISLNTVATHVRSILQKTESANRAEAACYAIRKRLA